MLEKDIRQTDSPHPLYIRLYEHLREFIDTETARKTGKLPTEKELCSIFGVSRNTVSQALSMLEEEKLICRIKHRGTFLTSMIGTFDPQSIRRTVGVIFPKTSAWDNTLDVIRRDCRNLGFDFRLYSYLWNDDCDGLKKLEQACKFSGGIILYPGQKWMDNELILKLSRSLPTVMFDLYQPGIECNCVAADHYQGAYLLVQELIKMKCRKFCILTDARHSSSLLLRKAGFLQALEDFKIKYDPSWQWNFNMDDFPAFQERHNFDAVLDTSKHFFTVPPPGKKICLARFDLVTEAEKEFFTTVTARQDTAALGANAMSLLKSVMRSELFPGRKVLITPKICVNQ